MGRGSDVVGVGDADGLEEPPLMLGAEFHGHVDGHQPTVTSQVPGAFSTGWTSIQLPSMSRSQSRQLMTTSARPRAGFGTAPTPFAQRC
jgi:hypothetical protein